MKYLTILILSFLMLSCNESEKTKKKTEPVQEEVALTKKDISNIDFTDYILDSKSKKAVADWKNYTELEAVVTDLEEGNLSYLKNNSEIITAFIKDFKSSIPENLNTNAITARILALETTLLKLENAVNLSLEKTLLLETIKEFLIANSNLKLQINKKFEKENQRIQKPN